MSAADLIRARLRGESVDVPGYNKQTRDANVKQNRDDEQWVRTRAEELRENGLSLHAAHERAQRELRARKNDEAAQRERERVDGMVRANAKRDREDLSDENLQKKLRDVATPVELRKMKAEELLRRRAIAELEAEQQD
ncbi:MULTISPECIES: hypothetical protein [unclassified Nocardiopsis]|uniref:hypothetical protein n=1 Tax=unclassified Nocardiopsis TaxID=2649073 RepID=UPI00116126F4|nr:hypothetical protein [Nocardiopsis sp. TSRI0078]